MTPTCLQDVKASMTNNFLLLTSDKTEQLRITLSSNLTSNTSAIILGVIINQDLLLDLHIKQI